MKDRIMIRKRIPALLVGGALLAMGACLENPVEPHPHEEPEGMNLEVGGVVVVTVDEHGDVDGSLTVAAGQESDVITITFVDHDGDPIDTDDYYVEVESADEGIVQFLQDGPGAFTGRLRGIAPGSTTLEFRLMHGSVGTGHLEFRSPPIPVTVLE